MTSTTTRLLINGGAAPKTGAHSSGAVLYRLFTDAACSDVFIAITGNEGGSGYFSREAVPFSKVMQGVTGRPDAQQPLASKALMAVFQGRSTNNGGFLAAILRHLGLLAPAPEAAHQHVPVGDWEAWRRQQLNAPAKPFLEPASLTPPAAGEDSNAVSAGVSLFQVQTLLGHSSAQMTQRYAHLAGTALHDASAAAARAMLGASQR